MILIITSVTVLKGKGLLKKKISMLNFVESSI